MVQRATIRICGTVGLIGAVFPILADVISWFLAEGYNPMRDSISALAVGPSSWLSDLGVQAFGVGCVAVAFGMGSLQSGARLWIAARAALALVGVCALIIAEVNERPNSTWHLATVLAMAVLFALACFLAAPGLRGLSARLARTSIGIGIAWMAVAPVYWFLAQSWSGAVERLLAAMLLVWLGMTSTVLLDEAGARRKNTADG